MANQISQAHINYNRTTNHAKSRVHKVFTSDNPDNQRNYSISLKPVVNRINYYQQLIECPCEQLVKGGGGDTQRAGEGTVSQMTHMASRANASRSVKTSQVNKGDGAGQTAPALGGCTPVYSVYTRLISPPNKKEASCG